MEQNSDSDSLLDKITKVHILCVRVDERTTQNAASLKELKREARIAMQRVQAVESKQSFIKMSWLALIAVMSALSGVVGAWITRHFN